MGVWRVFVISDLHIGTLWPPMMSQPKLLAEWIRDLPKQCASDEQLVLVLAGDIIDFLAVPCPRSQETEPWTPDPIRAREKLQQVMHGFHKPVFEALAKHVGNGHDLVVLVGNHDLELSIAEVQRGLCDELGVAHHRVCFVDDGRPWRLGRLLVTHGNRYDDANLNDNAHIREARSAWEYGAAPRTKMHGSVGSDLVTSVLNPLKLEGRYPWLDLLQPQGIVLYYLLREFEPGLNQRLADIWRVLRASWKQNRSRPREPHQTYAVSGTDDARERALAERIQDIFGEAPPQDDGTRPVSGRRPWIVPEECDTSLSRTVDSLPEVRLRRLQERFTRLADADGSLVVDDHPGVCGEAAERLRHVLELDTVVMGHTHHPRHEGEDPDRCAYTLAADAGPH